MHPSSVLIIADDSEFARTLMSRWQAERSVPLLTLVSSELWNGASPEGYELVIVGAVRTGKTAAILSALDHSPAAVLWVTRDSASIPAIRAQHPRLIVLPQQDGWTETLLLVASEALRRSEALARARQAERAAASSLHLATLGQFMLEMRHSFNNALTSVLGNADLLLLEPGELSAPAREQIQTIHTMALRLHEILQRFSSLASEMQLAEKESHTETAAASQAVIRG